MGVREQAQRRFRALINSKQDTIQRKRGILGNGSGVVRVPDRNDVVFIRINADPNNIWKVFNDQVGDIDGLPVIIEEQPDSRIWRVVEIDRGVIYQAGSGWDGVKLDKTHGEEHEWPDLAPGPDTVNVFARSLVPLRTEPTTPSYSLNLNIRPYRYTYEGVIKEFPGETLNVAAYIPGAGIRYAVSYLDVRENASYIIAGSPIAYEISTSPPFPILPWYAKASAIITLRQAQSIVTEADILSIADIHHTSGIKHNLQAERVPTTTDDYSSGYSAGSIWIDRSSPAVYVCVTPGLGAADWNRVDSAGSFPFTTNVITVDPAGNADHTTLADALAAASAGNIILFDGTHTITGSVFDLSKVVTLQGISPETSIITSSLTTGTVTVTAAATIRNCKILNTATSGTTVYALDISSSTVLVENVTANRSGSGVTNSYAIQITSGTGVRIKSCTTSASGGSSSTYGVIALGSSSVTVEQGKHDNFSATSSATVVLVDVFLTDPFGGWTGSVTGTIRDAEGRDVGFIVTNSSGATANTGDIGYLDEAGEFQTTTTAQDSKMVGNGCVVTIGGANTEKIFVKRTGNVAVNYTGSAPAAGDFLVSSTSAGDAQTQTTMHPNIFAVCTAAGSGGQVEVQLLINRTPVGLSSTNDVIRVDLHSGTVFTGTIVQFTGGDSKLIEYNISTGNEASIKPASASELGKFVLHNTTRGNTALIDSVNTTDTATPAAGTITTLSTPVGWSASDVIEVNSQTNTQTHGSVKFFEVDLSSADNTVIPVLATAIIIEVTLLDTGGSDIDVVVHPFEAYADSKTKFVTQPVANIAAPAQKTIPLINQRFTIACEASGSSTAIFVARITGAWIASP